MATPIRPEDLPAVPSLGADDALIVDTGAGVFRTTPEEIVAAGGAVLPPALAASDGASLIGFLQDGTGAVAATLESKAQDIVDVWDFMTDEMKEAAVNGLSSVDHAPAFQAAFDFASTKDGDGSSAGRRLICRGGTYRWNSPVTFDWRRTSAVIDEADMRRLFIDFSGRTNTVIYYLGSSASPALTISGYIGGANGGTTMNMPVRGFWLRRHSSLGTNGIGIKCDGCSGLKLEDISVDNFDTNVDLVDVLRFSMQDSQVLGSATYGLRARLGTFTHPNVFQLTRVDFGGNAKQALLVERGANVRLLSCGFEGNGANATSYDIVEFRGGPIEGGIGPYIDNCYFENNGGRSNIFLNWTAQADSGSAAVAGCTFIRSNGGKLTTYHILVSAESAGQLKANIFSCGFVARATYTSSSSRPVIALTSTSSNALVSGVDTCQFDNDDERPLSNGWPIVGDGPCQTAAILEFTSAGAISSQWNVASLSKPNVGTYALTFKRALRSSSMYPVFMGNGGAFTVCTLSAQSTTGCTIVTANMSGAAADRGGVLVIYGQLN